MCWNQSKGSFLRRSCGDCYFVTLNLLKSSQHKACVWECVGRVFHTAPLSGPKKSPQLTTCCTIDPVYTRKQIFKTTSHQEWWYVRGGESDFFLWGRIFFFFFRIYLTSLTSSFQEQITGIDKMIQQKMLKERMRSEGGVLFKFFFFQ